MRELTKLLEKINLGAPTKLGNLFMVPVIGTEKENANYYNLTGSLKEGTAEITEVSESGDVPKILFKNRADKPILLVDGEELVGCKQNRVLNLSVLAPASEETEIPVSCVEQGRWSSRGRNFRTSENFEFADLKAAKMRSLAPLWNGLLEQILINLQFGSISTSLQGRAQPRLRAYGRHF